MGHGKSWCALDLLFAPKHNLNGHVLLLFRVRASLQTPSTLVGQIIACLVYDYPVVPKTCPVV